MLLLMPIKPPIPKPCNQEVTFWSQEIQSSSSKRLLTALLSGNTRVNQIQPRLLPGTQDRLVEMHQGFSPQSRRWADGSGTDMTFSRSIFFFVPSNWRLANQVLFSWGKALGLGLAALLREKNLSELLYCLVWWCSLLIPVLRRQRQEDLWELVASLMYTVSHRTDRTTKWDPISKFFFFHIRASSVSPSSPSLLNAFGEAAW